MSARAEADTLIRIVRVGRAVVVGRFEPREIDPHRFRGGFACERRDREALLQWLLRALGSAPFTLAYTLLACVDTCWNADITNRALQLVANASRSDTQQWSHTRTALAEWGRRVDVTAAAAKLPDILERCPPESPWRNALEHLNALVDFRLAMHKELLT